jgi:hypothetical protein
MQRVFKIVDKERGLAQLTTDDERWYIREVEDPKTKKKSHVHLPSSSWISSYYPKGVAYYKWLADKGWNEAEAIKEDRGKHGSKVHKAVELLLAGEKINMDEPILNPKTGMLEELNVEEYGAVISFAEWYKTLRNPELVESEYTVWNEKDGYAGTLDMILKIDGETWLIDLKTSQSIWASHEIQVASYAHAVKIPNLKLAVLQVGYKRNKNMYKFTELEDKYPLFLAAKQMWANECKNMTPYQKDYPLSVTLTEVGIKANVSKGVKPIKKVVEKKKVTKTKKKK